MKTNYSENSDPRSPLGKARHVAPLVGVGERCLINWFHRRLIPGYRVGKTILFDADEVLAAIKKQKR